MGVFGGDDDGLSSEYISSLATQVTAERHILHSSDLIISWVVEILSMDMVPSVVLLAFAADERAVLPSWVKVFDITTKILAAMGVTVIASAGDSGASTIRGTQDQLKCQYSPLWPATSPLVLSVGVTRLVDGEESSCSKGTGDTITSGGGFSNLYKRPSWQVHAIDTYLESLSDAHRHVYSMAGFNITGRGYPDISLIGYNVVQMVDDELIRTDSSVNYSDGI